MTAWGVTGTREGGTPAQLAMAAWLFSACGITELHDGDCTGADIQVYYLGKAFGARSIRHPPSNPKYRAFKTAYDDVFRIAKSYIERDKDIVDACETLLGIPRKATEEFEHSGTWNTIRYARTRNKPIVIVWPNGGASYENWPEAA